MILALIFVLSLGAINAVDLNQTDMGSNLNSKSFDELNGTIYEHIENDTAVCNLDSDYEFVDESDGEYVNGISIVANTTINGHGHIIDCKIINLKSKAKNQWKIG